MTRDSDNTPLILRFRCVTIILTFSIVATGTKRYKTSVFFFTFSHHGAIPVPLSPGERLYLFRLVFSILFRDLIYVITSLSYLRGTRNKNRPLVAFFMPAGKREIKKFPKIPHKIHINFKENIATYKIRCECSDNICNVFSNKQKIS